MILRANFITLKLLLMHMFVKHQRFDYHSIFEPVENTIQLFKYIDRICSHSAKDLRDSLKFCLLLHTKLTPEISDV